MLDVLVFGPHPDDAELGCGGAIVKAVKSGLRVGIVDLTAGEMGTKGDKEIRLKEAQKAKEMEQNLEKILDYQMGILVWEKKKNSFK